MNKLITIIFLSLLVHTLPAQESSVLKVLFDSSDVVVQGTITDLKCKLSSLSVNECLYKCKIDSIYKGNPTVFFEDPVPGSTPENGTGQAMEFIHFSRDCFSGENCLAKKQRVILFLRNVPNSASIFALSDRWLGIQTYSEPLATEIRSILWMANQ
jgi:hypothetical protein